MVQRSHFITLTNYHVSIAKISLMFISNCKGTGLNPRISVPLKTTKNKGLWKDDLNSDT